MDKEKLIQSLFVLLIVIVGSVILIRYFSNGQTLSEYATENEIPIHSQEK